MTPSEIARDKWWAEYMRNVPKIWDGNLMPMGFTVERAWHYGYLAGLETAKAKQPKKRKRVKK